MDIKELLIREFFAWQMKQGRPCTQTEFAAWLGVKQQSLSNWMRGDYVPRKLEDISKLADKLGFEVFDALGLNRPWPAEVDEKILHVAKQIQKFPPEFRMEVMDALIETGYQAVQEGFIGDQKRLASLLLETICEKLGVSDLNQLRMKVQQLPSANLL